MLRYIILLDSPPLASYTGTIPGLAATRPDTIKHLQPSRYTGVHVDPSSPESIAYLSYLQEQQDAFLSELRIEHPAVGDPLWRYTITANGVALRLPMSAAIYASKMPAVRAIQREEDLIEELDASASLVGAPSLWQQNGLRSTQGQGARIAVAEAAHAVNHSFFADDAMPEPPSGYPIVEIAVAGSAPVIHDGSRRILTNKKIIGVRLFAEMLSAEQEDSFLTGDMLTNHGAHLAGIAAGTTGEYQILPDVRTQISGVAPRAQLLSYPLLGGTPELLASLEAAAGKDKIDAFILSMGTRSWLSDAPTNDVIGQALLGASDAGVSVVTSAGNQYVNRGPMTLTGGWKHSSHVITVGASGLDGGSGLIMKLRGGIPTDTREALILRALGGAQEALAAPLKATIGNGCQAESGLEGKIAVAPSFTLSVRSGGTSCVESEASRAMADSGAVGLILADTRIPLGMVSAPSLPVSIPTYFLEHPVGPWLLDALRAGREFEAEVSPKIVRSWYRESEFLMPITSRGPAFDGGVKPDLSAPGSNIVSSVIDTINLPYDPIDPSLAFQPLSGTSMAAAHVAGAIALLRSLHPDWTVPMLRSAVMTTGHQGLVNPAYIENTRSRSVDTGAGRLDVFRAADPGVIIDPPSVGFGHLTPETGVERRLTATAVDDQVTCWRILSQTDQHVSVSLEPERLLLWPGETTAFTISLMAEPVPSGVTEGALVLEELAVPHVPAQDPVYLPALVPSSVVPTGSQQTKPPNPRKDFGFARNGMDRLDDSARTGLCLGGEPPTGRSLRVPFLGFADLPAAVRRNVLLVNHTTGSPANHLTYYTNALDEAGLTYTVWDMARSSDRSSPGDIKTYHPELSLIKKHDMVLVNTDESTQSMQHEKLEYIPQYHTYLLQGGNLLISGQGPANGWRYLRRSTWIDEPGSTERYPETYPHRWRGPDPESGCELCLVRYFAGFTPHLTATLSGRLLLPFGTTPARPAKNVVLPPHPAAEPDSPFAQYRLDISTGRFAKDQAAGNQYTFASGDVLGEYLPSTPDDPATVVDESQLWQNLRDVDETPWLRPRDAAGHILPDFARPLWSYKVGDETKVVGTYIAGRQHPEADIPWNAMFWGFGLEGVGEAGPGTASRTRLMADAFNFLAKNIRPQAKLTASPDGGRSVQVNLGPQAQALSFARAVVRYGSQGEDSIAFAPADPSTQVDLPLRPQCPAPSAPTPAGPCADYLQLAPGDLRLTLYPLPGSAAIIQLQAQ